MFIENNIDKNFANRTSNNSANKKADSLANDAFYYLSP